MIVAAIQAREENYGEHSCLCRHGAIDGGNCGRHFPPGCRREYLEWIAEAKQDATRAKRIEIAIEWLSEGKRRNWKYESC